MMSASQDPSNRRQHERVDQKGYVKVIVEDCPNAPSLEGAIFRCTTRDLSLSGLKLVVHTSVPVDSMVRVLVVFTKPAAEFEHSARVAWVKDVDGGMVQQHELGLKFTETHSPAGHEWSEFIRSQMLGSKGVQ